MIKGNIFSHLFQSLLFSSKTENEALSFYSIVVPFFRILHSLRIDPVHRGPCGCRLLPPAPPEERPTLLPTLHTLQSPPSVSHAGEIVSFYLGRIRYFW